jgi:hypothetical protein
MDIGFPRDMALIAPIQGKGFRVAYTRSEWSAELRPCWFGCVQEIAKEQSNPAQEKILAFHRSGFAVSVEAPDCKFNPELS